jgi:hypothetical protein
MKIEIKSRYSGEVLFAHEQENNTIRITLELAVKARANLTEANLTEANLYGANLTEANLTEANLYRANLRGANLTEANLYRANLRGADLTEANLRAANLRGANLRGANLTEANLYGANLTEANLTEANLLCVGDMQRIFTIQLDTWHIGFTKDTLQIGCQRHLIEKWKTFDDEIINKMDNKALEWWRKWKDHIFKTIELCNEP